MKTFYSILTVIFWISVVLASIMIIRSFSSIPANMPGHLIVGYVIGSVLGAAIVPAIIGGIKYLVAKELKK
jgi:hypothetical protein